MKNNLVPEKRPDKNGNLVTRWIRSFAGRDTAKNIPAPKVPKLKTTPISKSRERQYKDLAKLLQQNQSLDTGMRSTIPAKLKTVALYDPELLDRITASCAYGNPSDRGFEREFWAKTLARQPVLSGEYQTHLKQTLDKYHAAFVINPLLKRISDSSGVSSAMRFEDVVHNITYGKVTRENLKGDFDDTIAAVSMIVHIKELHLDVPLDDADDKSLTDREILENAKHIAPRVDEVERILPELRERRAFDRETIDMLLDAPSPSLMEGLL